MRRERDMIQVRWGGGKRQDLTPSACFVTRIAPRKVRQRLSERAPLGARPPASSSLNGRDMGSAWTGNVVLQDLTPSVL
jgi:hypothetical protein